MRNRMDEQPEQPTSKPGHARPSEVGNGVRAANGGHVAWIAITNSPRRFAADASDHIACGVTSFLLRDLRHARKLLPTLMREAGKIAGVVGLIRHRKIRLHDHTSRTIQRHTERSTQL